MCELVSPGCGARRFTQDYEGGVPQRGDDAAVDEHVGAGDEARIASDEKLTTAATSSAVPIRPVPLPATIDHVKSPCGPQGSALPIEVEITPEEMELTRAPRRPQTGAAACGAYLIGALVDPIRGARVGNDGRAQLGKVESNCAGGRGGEPALEIEIHERRHGARHRRR